MGNAERIAGAFGPDMAIGQGKGWGGGTAPAMLSKQATLPRPALPRACVAWSRREAPAWWTVPVDPDLAGRRI